MKKFLSKIREKLLGKSRITDEEYTQRAIEINEREKNDSEQEKRNIRWMKDSEQIPHIDEDQAS